MRETDKALTEYGYRHVFGALDTHYDYSVWQKGANVLLRDNRTNEVLSVNTLESYGAKGRSKKGVTYLVERNCCTSGQCFACRHLPRGIHVRVEQTRTPDKAQAEVIAGNWREYGAVVKEAPQPVTTLRATDKGVIESPVTVPAYEPDPRD